MTPEEARAYQQAILGYLGADDPAVVQAAEAESWRVLLSGAGPHMRTRPAAGEWSALECLGHLTDSELVTSTRYRWVLAENEPALIGWDQEVWAERFDHSGDDPDALLALFTALRSANLELWARTPVAARSRVGIHAERGPESYELLFRMQAGHGILHRAQAERALVQVRRTK